MLKYDTNQNGTIELEEFVADHNVSAERFDKKCLSFIKYLKTTPHSIDSQHFWKRRKFKDRRAVHAPSTFR